MEKQKRIIKPKTRGNGTLTEAQFWAKIRNSLRQASRYWAPGDACKKEAKRPYKGLNKKQKFEYLCNHCKKGFPEKEVQKDHVLPAGSLNKASDFESYIERLFCEKENYQILCSTCHTAKSLKDNQAIKDAKKLKL